MFGKVLVGEGRTLGGTIEHTVAGMPGHRKGTFEWVLGQLDCESERSCRKIEEVFSARQVGDQVVTASGKRYRIEGVLGTGGQGTVFRVSCCQTGRVLALKLANCVADPASCTVFENEYQCLTRVRGNHVVRALLHGYTREGEPFILMELVEGETLAQLLRRNGPLSEARAARICAQVAAALVEAHRAGILHKDLKPSNILVGAGDHVTVIDFGISYCGRRPRAQLSSSSLSGTITYMSPEQVAGREIGPASDVYQLGLVLFECLYGSLPFSSGIDESMDFRKDPRFYLARFLAAEYGSQGLPHLIERMLNPIATQRLASMRRIVRMLTAGCPGRTCRDRKGRRLGRGGKAVRRSFRGCLAMSKMGKTGLLTERKPATPEESLCRIDRLDTLIGAISWDCRPSR